MALAALTSCVRDPELHLHSYDQIEMDFPIVNLALDVYWNYGFYTDWKEEWFYGWDDEDRRIFSSSEPGYTMPEAFHLRRYFTGDVPKAPHTTSLKHFVQGRSHEAQYKWGFWDLLVWNDIVTSDGVQSIIIDESQSLDYVYAYTNQSMNVPYYSRSRSYYQPEELFSAYVQAMEINKNMDGFTFNPERNVWVKTLKMQLEPITYIYLVQVILHNNRGKIASVDGNADLSGMARTVCLNDGVTGKEAIDVYYNTRLKKNMKKGDEAVDIIGGRLLTFGMTNLNPNRVMVPAESKGAFRVNDNVRHYIDMNMQFVNGKDSTFVFDVTDRVRERYRGGVITIELDCDTIKMPMGVPGSGFDAEVEDWQDGGTHEFDM